MSAMRHPGPIRVVNNCVRLSIATVMVVMMWLTIVVLVLCAAQPVATPAPRNEKLKDTEQAFRALKIEEELQRTQPPAEHAGDDYEFESGEDPRWGEPTIRPGGPAVGRPTLK